LYFNNSLVDKINFISGIDIMKYVHVQSVLPQEDIIALKEKSGETSVKEAIVKAVYHYLKCDLANKDE